MPALFTSPRFVALSSTNQLLPGAKLYFRQTGTSTPQNTYQDEALTVPHANPVIADGAGVFAPIYLDPSLPNYRVILADSSDVTQPGYPIDNVPSNQNTGQTFRLKSAAPELVFEETDAAADNKKIRFRLNAQRLMIELLNDAEGVATEIFSNGRLGTTSDEMRLTANAVYVNNERIAYGSRNITASDNTVNNSTTLTDWTTTVTQLQAARYRVYGFLAFYGAGAEGFKWKINSSVSTTSRMFYSGFVNGAGVSGRTNHLTTISHGTISSDSANPDVIAVHGYMQPTALATITLQFAQVVATVTNTRLMAGSFLEFSRLN